MVKVVAMVKARAAGQASVDRCRKGQAGKQRFGEARSLEEMLRC